MGIAAYCSGIQCLRACGGILKKQKKISFSGSEASYQNGSLERAINTMVTISNIVLKHVSLICFEEIFYTDLCPMEIYYDVWVYNLIPEIQYGLSAI